ncbi:MAG: hypothetical protein JWQ06_300, partial [Mucilaginibacter sp.]|nr:hypothetical protein [Mucilaginibacter sp.]
MRNKYYLILLVLAGNLFIAVNVKG